MIIQTRLSEYLLLSIFCIASFAIGEDKSATTQESKTNVFETKDFAIALPAGWKDYPKLQSVKRPLHSIGDGKGIPLFDDTESPLQVGIGVEHFDGFKLTLEECVQVQKDSVDKAKNLEQIGSTTEQLVKLSDGRDAVILRFEFLKEKHRHSTYIKLITKGLGDDHWIVSAWAVGSKDAKQIASDKPLAIWLSKHLETFTLDLSKMDQNRIPPPLFPES